MATIRAYTTIEQSRKLAEILPLESADMTYCAITEGMREKMTIKNWEVNVGLDIAIKKNLFSYRNGYMVPCWSLSSLLGVLPMITKGKDTANPFIAKTSYNEYYVVYATLTKEVESSAIYNNPIDACYEMIIRLNELNLL